MRKMLFCFLTTLVFLQLNSAHAARYVFAESIAENATIIDTIGNPNSEFSKLFSPNDVIKKLDRETDEISVFGKVNYLLETCRKRQIGDVSVSDAKSLYRVSILVKDAFGNPEITVTNIEEISQNNKKHPLNRFKCGSQGQEEDIFEESVAEYQAILHTLGERDPRFADLFLPYDAVTKLDRKTKKVLPSGKVKYILKTCSTELKEEAIVCSTEQTYLITILNSKSNFGSKIKVLSIVEISPDKTQKKRNTHRFHHRYFHQ